MNIDYVTAHLDKEDRVMAIIWDQPEGEPEIGLTLGWLSFTMDVAQARTLHRWLGLNLDKLDEKGYTPPGRTPDQTRKTSIETTEEKIHSSRPVQAVGGA